MADLSLMNKTSNRAEERNMTTNEVRPVLLLGSVPLESSRAVFETVADALGDLAKRIPDGEVGARTQWIMCQEGVVKGAKGIEPAATREIAPGYHFTTYKVRSGGSAADVEFGALGYADAARHSYDEFKRLRAEGKIPSGTRFQVCLPTSLAIAKQFFEPDAVVPIWSRYEARLCQEMAEIADAVPHRELAMQFDICVEICAILEVPELAKQIPMEQLVASIAQISSHVPADAELGLHFCYGDPGHKHLVEPKDTALMVEFANQIVAAVKRPITWIHMPVPRERDDDAYFAPLKNLKLKPETEFYLGLVHFTDGIQGAQRRLAAAKRVVNDFGVATECGFGRRPPETIPGLLKLHREVAEAV
jgi:hypothetical protein